jgi:hypothetical protein
MPPALSRFRFPKHRQNNGETLTGITQGLKGLFILACYDTNATVRETIVLIFVKEEEYE